MNEESTAALALLSRMRFACGDNGARMQDELEEYLRELKRDAERWRRARCLISAVEIEEAVREIQCGERSACEEHNVETDLAIDAAMNGANTQVQP